LRSVPGIIVARPNQRVWRGRKDVELDVQVAALRQNQTNLRVGVDVNFRKQLKPSPRNRWNPPPNDGTAAADAKRNL
jgi:hypothetical protein